MNRWLLRAMTELTSRKFVSRLTGRLAKSPLSRRMIPRFAKLYRIAVHEAEKPVEQYGSLNEFFTRRLKPGARVVDRRPKRSSAPSTP
jgi:phosphatidylserine decarboxylase